MLECKPDITLRYCKILCLEYLVRARPDRIIIESLERTLQGLRCEGCRRICLEYLEQYPIDEYSLEGHRANARYRSYATYVRSEKTLMNWYEGLEKELRLWSSHHPLKAPKDCQLILNG